MTNASSRFKNARALAALALSASLAAAGCSGGGGGDGGGTGSTGGGTSPPPPPPAVTTPVWAAGVFEPASDFKDLCAVVRPGVDIEGNAFPDQPGSLVEEKFWLRSWTYETYLWNNEVADLDPGGPEDRLEYFEQLKTTATTPSGIAKDPFHFSAPTEEFLAERNSVPTASYGAALISFSVFPPRDYRVLFTEPGSPASEEVLGQPKLVRGSKILTVDGVDLVFGGATQAEIDILSAGLFPATAGETHTFVVEDPGAAGTRTVTLQAVDIAPEPVNRTAVIDTPTGKVGYILFNTFSPFASEADVADAMTAMKAEGIDDLVLDLRYNGGGLLAVASQLSYMIAGDTATAGRTFEQLEFNGDAGIFDPVTGEINEPTPFLDIGLGFSLAPNEALDSLALSRVFILSSEATCSASESVINSLRGIDVEVILIGDGTCGKPYGFYPTDNCGETYFTIQFRGVNHKGFGDYADGFIPANDSSIWGVRLPGCSVADDLDHELGEVDEALLAAALQYREDGSCPIAPLDLGGPPDLSAQSADGPQVASADTTPLQAFLRSNRDMTMP